MDHNERIKIAEHIARKVVASCKKEILIAGLCGSTVRNEDLEFSDIDVLFITTNNSSLKGKDFLFQDIQIALAFIKLKEAQKILKTVDLYWPLRVSRFFCIKKYGVMKKSSTSSTRSSARFQKNSLQRN